MLGKKPCLVFPLEEQVCFLGWLQVGFFPGAVLIRVPSSRLIRDLGDGWAASASWSRENYRRSPQTGRLLPRRLGSRDLICSDGQGFNCTSCQLDELDTAAHSDGFIS